jgi:hypothetical protein
MGYAGSDSSYRRDTAKLNALRRKQVEARIAQRRFINAQLFYADSVGKIRRKAADKLNNTLYDLAEVRQLGWVNVDKYYKGEDRANITYTIARKDSITYANVYLIFKDINAMVSNSFYGMDDIPTQSFGNMPVGKKARIVAVTYRKDRLLSCNLDITTAPDQHTHIIWQPTTEAELKNLFDVKDR